jgi:NDP-sugar pyrophosphorylase family protein
VLAGGRGTRLHPYTTVLPKPLVPVGDRPILELILQWLARAGVREADVCIGHLGELIQTYFSQAQTIPAGLEIRWQWENEPLGTAGALRFLPHVTDTLLVVNGDILTNLDMGPMLTFHRDRDAALTIATRRASVATELGVIEQRDGLVSGYREKPVFDYSASMGIYLYEPRALSALPEGECQFPDLVLALLARGERVGAFETDADWYHIGTPAEHLTAHQAIEATRYPAAPGDRGDPVPGRVGAHLWPRGLTFRASN